MKQDESEGKVAQNKDKLKELILYISEVSEGDEYFGATKLNKLLFFADFFAYLQIGKPITSTPYVVFPEGPMVKDFRSLRREMVENDKTLAVRPQDFWGLTQYRSFALRNAKTEMFSKEEIEIVDYVLSKFREYSAKQISTESHGFIAGWDLFSMGEEIPYETALIGTREPTPEEWELPEKLGIDFEKLGIEVGELVTA